MTPTLGTPEPAEAPEPLLVDPAEQSSLYGKDNRDLPEQLVNILHATISEFQGQEKYSRRREVRADWKLRLYQAGYQHLYWNRDSFTHLTPGASVQVGSGSIQCPAYMDAYNIFLRFFLIIQAVLTQTLPPVRWQPIDPDNPEDVDKNKEAQNYAKLFDRHNDIKDLLGQVVRMFAMSGRTVAWTRTEEDSQRFGFEPDGSPKRFQRTTIHGTLETKVPVFCREFDRTCLYVFIYEDHDVKASKALYPWIADKIKAGNSALDESKYERFARLGVLNGSRGQSQVGDSLTHIVTDGHFFLRPEAFTGPIFDIAMEDGGGTVKDKLLGLFPQGCRVVFSGGAYAAAYPESMDDHLHLEWPYQGDGMFRQAFMEVMSIVQDNFNDLCNWIREKVDTGAGATWANGSQDEIDAVTSQRAAPNAIRPAKQFKVSGEPLSNSFFQEGDPQIPATLFQLLEFMRGDLPEFLLAALPSLQGGEMTDNSTASGYAQATANAKGQLGILWARMQRMFARIRYQSALAAAQDERAQGIVTIPGKESGETISCNLDALKKGSFGCYPDEDSGFPETTAQKRIILKDWMTMAGQSPMAAELLDNPDNIELAKELNGFSEMVFIPAEARTKQLFEIEQLLQGAPLPPDPEQLQQAQVMHAASAFSAHASGAEAPPFMAPPDQPSVPVEELDYHQFEFVKCQEWLSSKARRDEDRKGNQQGVQNVILHALAHRAKMQQMAAAQAALLPQPAPSGKGQPSPPSEKKPTPGTQVPQAA